MTVVSSINRHNIYLNTQLGTIDIDINIEETYVGIDM